MGIYKAIEDRVKEHEHRNLTVTEKAAWSLLAGAIGSFITTPFDVALVRFQNDNNLPIEKRRNYNNVFDALRRILRE